MRNFQGIFEKRSIIYQKFFNLHDYTFEYFKLFGNLADSFLKHIQTFLF